MARDHVFEVDDLESVYREALALHPPGTPIETIFRWLTGELVRRYPGQVESEWKWMLNAAAGFMQPVNLLHVSMNEYLIFTGTPTPTGGGNGPYTVDIWDMILDGQLDIYAPGEFTVRKHVRGDIAYTPRGTTNAGQVPTFSWQLEYARGFVPLMFTTPVAGALFETVDLRTLTQTLTRATGIFFRQAIARLSP